MFTDIEQLEKEIQAFKKNILASNELIQTIEAVVAAAKKQNSDYQTATTALQDKMDTHADGLKKLSEDTIAQMLAESKKTANEVQGIANTTVADMSAANKTLLADTVEQLKAAQKVYIDALETVKVALSETTAERGKQLDEATEALKTAQKEYFDRLAQIETAITATKEELDNKYKAFLEKLESTNMDQIFKVCQEMKKSIEAKLLLLTGGVGIAIILMIVSFFIK